MHYCILGGIALAYSAHICERSQKTCDLEIQ